LEGSHFMRVELLQCSFYDARLSHADFRDARIRGGDFSRAVLEGARFGGAQMFTADFRGANLRGARELTSEQLTQSFTDQATILPNGSRGPYLRHSGAERPQ
jgi:uncharacterized protein YjbI with pentapeptide repeats